MVYGFHNMLNLIKEFILKKKYIFVILFILLCVMINADQINNEGNNIDFFGFNFNQSIDEVKKVLKKGKKSFKVKKEKDFIDQSIEYTIITPKNHNLQELKNVDYIIRFYKGKMLSIIKFHISESYQSDLLSKINYSEVIDNKSLRTDYMTDKYYIIFQESGGIQSIHIRNISVVTNIWDMQLSNLNPDDEVVIECIDNQLQLYEEPNTLSTVIRLIPKGEKLELLKKGNKDTNDNGDFFWYNVMTKYQHYGWVPSYSVKRTN
jgi:hypothetical protein